MPQGFDPELPNVVNTKDNFGKELESSVIWESFNENQFNSLNEIIEITETIVNTNVKVKAKILVTNKIGDGNISRQVTGFDYPAAFAGFANDRANNSKDRVEYLNDGIINQSTNKLSDWQADNNSPWRNNNYVGVIFANGGVLTKKQLEEIRIIFGKNSQSSAPKSYTIQYLDTMPDNLPNLNDFGHIEESDSNLKQEKLWKNVELTQFPEILSEDLFENIFKFKPITAYAVRIKFSHKDGTIGKGVLIYEFTALKPIAKKPNDYEINGININNKPLKNFDKNINEYTINVDSFPKIDFFNY